MNSKLPTTQKKFLYAVFAFLLTCIASKDNLAFEKGKVVTLSDEVSVQEIEDGIWNHISVNEVEGFGSVPANGLVIVSGNKGMAIDLPWTDSQTKTLFDWFKAEQQVTIDTVVPTHSHMDCSGGLAEAHNQGAKSWALLKTVEKLKSEKKEFPLNSFESVKTIQHGKLEVVLSYEGGGHTTDNIVVWIPARKVLFGGCAVKALAETGLGYIKEADAKSWPLMLNKLLEKYPDAKLVVPGHGDFGNLDLVRHSIKMITEGKRLGRFKSIKN